MNPIKLCRSMSHTELFNAVDHNSRCDITDMIDDALVEAIEIGGIAAVKALMIMKVAAKTEDFQDYEGEHYLAERDYEDRIVAIMDHLENSSDV